MWTTIPGAVEKQPTTRLDPTIQAENHAPHAEHDNPPEHDNHDGMTPADALQLLARWTAELRAENAGLRRENEWHIATLQRKQRRIRQLERLHRIADDRLYRFWMERFAPAEVDDLARELEAVA